MTFKESLSSDMDETFMNLDEFGETVTVNGQECIAVYQDDSSFQERGHVFEDRAWPEIPGRTVTVHIRTSDLPAEIDSGGTMYFNGELCTVITRSDQLGNATKLVLARNGY